MALGGYYYGFSAPPNMPAVQQYPNPGFIYPPMNQPVYSVAYPYSQPHYQPLPQLPPPPSNIRNTNPRSNLFNAPSIPSLSNIQLYHPPPHKNQSQPPRFNTLQIPTKSNYKKLQNDFNRGYEYDFDFMTSDSSIHNSKSHFDLGSLHSLSNSDKMLNEQYRSKSLYNRSISKLDYSNNYRWRTKSFNPTKLIRSFKGKINQAGILFTAIIYSICDCLFGTVSESNLYKIDKKLIDAFDGSRFDLTKLMLPNDRLMTEESIENLEFEILEQRANKLEKQSKKSLN